MPTRSEGSYSPTLRFAISTSRFTTIGMARSSHRQLELFPKPASVFQEPTVLVRKKRQDERGQAECLREQQARRLDHAQLDTRQRELEEHVGQSFSC